MRRLLFHVAVGSALLAPSVVGAAKDCGPTPKKYAEMEYGSALHGLDNNCIRTFSPQEQLFVAGLSRSLLESCGLPKDRGSRLKLEKFLTSSMWVSGAGRRYGDSREGLGNAFDSLQAYSAGSIASKSIGCGPEGERLSKGIVNYLDRTSGAGGGGSTYVDGCARYYSGQYTREQCQCVADIGRSIFPDIHQSAFSRESIGSIVNANPLVGLQMGMRCGIGDY
jgi:hypothetical protein